jgi:hypothetical protein
MENIKIEFTENEIKAISEFLSRVTLSGAEVPAFVVINNKFSKATQETIKKTK